ncbi:MAG: helix-turn-helix transcriptional regulator, partial [Treponema sp.]|nr:helix-turn-helix transcriptional regulator [Treponema sp.]
MSLEKTVIDNIKRIRKEKGMTQEQLAEACDTATSYIGLMEIYKNVPKLSTIERIAKAPTPPSVTLAGLPHSTMARQTSNVSNAFCMVWNGTSVANLVASWIAALRAAFSSSVFLGKPKAFIILL